VSDLQKICYNCENAHSAVIMKLKPVKDCYEDTPKLSKALREFASDPEARTFFHPDALCGDIDKLLMKLSSNLDPLKFAIDFNKIQALSAELKQIGNYDWSIYMAFDTFARQLDDLSTDLRSRRSKPWNAGSTRAK